MNDELTQQEENEILQGMVEHFQKMDRLERQNRWMRKNLSRNAAFRLIRHCCENKGASPVVITTLKILGMPD